MTEEERQALLSAALTYWFPIRWIDSDNVYERITYEFIGDLNSGGVRVMATKSGGVPIAIDFANEDCYGETKLAADAAMVKFFAAFGS